MQTVVLAVMPQVWKDPDDVEHCLDRHDVNTFNIPALFKMATIARLETTPHEVLEEAFHLSLNVLTLAKKTLVTLGQRWKNAHREGSVKGVRQTMCVTLMHWADLMVASFNILDYFLKLDRQKQAGDRLSEFHKPSTFQQIAAAPQPQRPHPEYQCFVEWTGLQWADLTNLSDGTIQSRSDGHSSQSFAGHAGTPAQSSSSTSNSASSFWGPGGRQHVEEMEVRILPAHFDDEEDEIRQTAAFFGVPESAMRDSIRAASRVIRSPPESPHVQIEKDKGKRKATEEEIRDAIHAYSSLSQPMQESDEGVSPMSTQSIDATSAPQTQESQQSQPQESRQSRTRAATTQQGGASDAASTSSSDVPLALKFGYPLQSNEPRALVVGNNSQSSNNNNSQDLAPTAGTEDDDEPVVKGKKKTQLQVSGRDEISERHLTDCTSCKSKGLECKPATGDGWTLKCEPCSTNRTVRPPCEHKEWRNQGRVTQWTTLVAQGIPKIDADCMVYGKLSVFGNPSHDKITNYSAASAVIRQQYCPSQFWNTVESPPRSLHSEHILHPHGSTSSALRRNNTGEQDRGSEGGRTVRSTTSTIRSNHSQRTQSETQTQRDIKRQRIEPGGGTNNGGSSRSISSTVRGSSHSTTVPTASRSRPFADPAAYFDRPHPTTMSDRRFREEVLAEYRQCFINAGRLIGQDGHNDATGLGIHIGLDRLLDLIHRYSGAHGESWTQIYGTAVTRRRR